MQYRHFERGTSNSRSGTLQSSSFIRHSQDDQESFAQRENFQSILASQRHAEILESLKRLTSSVVELQRSNEEMRNDFEQKICELHQLVDTFQSSNVPPAGSLSPASSVEQDIMTVEDYMHGKKIVDWNSVRILAKFFCQRFRRVLAVHLAPAAHHLSSMTSSWTIKPA